MNSANYLIKTILTLLIIALFFNFAFAQPAHQNIIPVFSQKISIKVPTSFKPAFEKPTKASYLLEFVPKNESVKNWSQMITVSGFRDLSSRIPLKKAFELEAQSIKRACPNDFITEVLPISFKQKYETFSVIMGCNKSPAIPQNKAEHAAYIFIKGKKDIYMIKKAFRNKVENIKLNSKTFEQLAPVLLSTKLCKKDKNPVKCEME